ncbi:F-box/LRR-repeat protein [Vitis vinifera]|uniref:F-box/LRR-repeat protein n=1 Tax=Vitis vinifera TaxID=29760 RepID=A0A438EK53_VITVI|nr:F-box/LRR-repeat protein [Vitis vinifera]
MLLSSWLLLEISFLDPAARFHFSLPLQTWNHLDLVVWWFVACDQFFFLSSTLRNPDGGLNISMRSFLSIFLVMENLPVEVVGNILSRLGAARDVVIASATCRKWREAWQNHLHTLSFNSNDWPVYHDLTTTAPVIAWLMYTRETLRQLYYNVRTTPSINILEKCSRQKLEVLDLAQNSITGVEPSYQKFPCLKSLSLRYVSISALDLNLLLTACPKIEVLALINLDIALSDATATMELAGPSLKDIYVEAISMDKFTLEADNLENLHLKDCTLDVFELIGKGALRILKIDDVSVIHLDIGESTENLEVVDVSNFTIMWPKFYHMISRSSKLKRLRLWGVVFDDEDEVVDLEAISVCFPRLTHVSLSYDLRDGDLRDGYGLQVSTHLENVVVLELGWTVMSNLFSPWVAGLVDRCPNLKKLIILGLFQRSKLMKNVFVNHDLHKQAKSSLGPASILVCGKGKRHFTGGQGIGCPSSPSCKQWILSPGTLPCAMLRFGPFGNGVNFRDTESVPVNLVQSSSFGAVRCSHHLNIYSMQMGICPPLPLLISWPHWSSSCLPLTLPPPSPVRSPVLWQDSCF